MGCLPGSEIANLLTAVSVIIILGAYVCIFHFGVQPFQRHFFCNDESISYPYKPDTVTIIVAAVVGAAIILLTVVIIEIVRHAMRSNCRASESDRTYANCLGSCGLKPESRCTRATVAIFRGLLLAALGTLITEVVTVTVKTIIGRHRPHFLAVCRANTSSPEYLTACASHQPLSPSVCHPVDSKQFREAMLSFPSGHSSHSIYMTLFAALYMQSRFTFAKGHAVKWLLQSFVLVWGLAVCASRVSDYKHHWSDVLGGGLIGAAVALLVCLYLRPSYTEACSACGFVTGDVDGGCASDVEAGGAAGAANNNNGDAEADSPRNNMNEMALLNRPTEK
ncbi:hypothetical protein BOX15_Mlig009350g2 [Macrostomum lignano]|uniref:Phosphatidic acid phosphatase type 2/haloperoxidase domain-containing protein n=1 Tax=Macrostomum lignano TaxID=282301 RepID=A0A267G948_9PLAT|nr:hypothetical protein BOX15_Mlig009350g2 [Macrostomum lignano]